jgi:hypothetical protein
MAPAQPIKNVDKTKAVTFIYLTLIPATSLLISSCEIALRASPNF